MDGRFYNPWNTDAATKSFTDFVNVRACVDSLHITHTYTYMCVVFFVALFCCVCVCAAFACLLACLLCGACARGRGRRTGEARTPTRKHPHDTHTTPQQHIYIYTQLMQDRRGWPRMPSEELAELRQVMVMGEEERLRNLKAIRVRTVSCCFGCGDTGWGCSTTHPHKDQPPLQVIHPPPNPTTQPLKYHKK